jgi:lipopolysaccharide biosynthesis protein
VNTKARVIAFYLPQYHPIPENDEWWGKGFTEWTNVGKAKPLFRGHYQPKVPADLGYYDLRVPETRCHQAALARDYGVEAFCYYHYWFAGRHLLQRPLQEVLASGEPQFPFCICWANQTWSGIWHGNPERILVEQTYPGLADHLAHFQYLLRAFADSRYLTIDGKPLFIVFRPQELPESLKVTDYWRELATKAGLKGLYLVGVHFDPAWVPALYGFDAAVTSRLAPVRPRVSWRNPTKRLYKQFQAKTGVPTIYDYAPLATAVIFDDSPGIQTYPCAIPNWDNTPRSGSNGLVLDGATPEKFRGVLRKALGKVEKREFEHRIIFIKSWNEWAEGNYLEPDLRYGHGFLQALRSEIAAV